MVKFRARIMPKIRDLYDVKILLILGRIKYAQKSYEKCY